MAHLIMKYGLSIGIGLLLLLNSGCSSPKQLSFSEKLQQQKIYYSSLSEEEQIKAVKEQWWRIGFIKNPTYRVQKTALDISPHAIEDIDHPTKEIQILAVRKIMKDGSFNTALTKLINSFSEEAQIEAVKHNPQIIQYIPYPSPKVQLAAVKVNPFVVKNIINATDEAKQEAVKLNPRVAKFLR
ncbi:hypothetical protein [Sulfurimonas paralvinellae]|uniref:DUF4116 domain-containing protein n=1 Tax=Sulfurimonas paralvinellae TaxID=317658 RepID=A0A7M1BA26_9BACT|nr:hypothetical protein [Sulfurimonas paralvinellae]QOP45592.1 hypothetical protein FM071_04545 [Sulfurimonas paralvinellae]